MPPAQTDRSTIAEIRKPATSTVMVGFADRVRIKRTDETQRLGLADRLGQVFGWTTPSVTGVSVIGSPADDSAVNVHFDELDEAFWFSEELVEQVDNAAGTVLSLDG